MLPENERKRGRRYDKIMRKNFETPSNLLLGHFFPGEILKTVPVPNRIHQHIMEQETDMLLEVEIRGKHPFIFHIEFQSGNDPTMAMRMASYDFMLHLKHKKDIIGVVIYVGEQRMSMRDTVRFNDNYYRCALIDIRDIDTELFLRSFRADETIFAILASYNTDESRIIIQKILARLHELLPQSPDELKEKIKELELIGGLRGEIIQKQIVEEEDKMIIEFDLTKDIRYKQGKKQGIEQGIEQGKMKFALKMAKQMLKDGVNPSAISKYTGISGSALENLMKKNT